MEGRLVPLAKSYLGGGKWGKATAVGADALIDAHVKGVHFRDRGITRADAEHKELMTGTFRHFRQQTNAAVKDPRTPYRQVKSKGKTIHVVPLIDDPHAAGKTTPIGIPKGKSQRSAHLYVATDGNPSTNAHEMAHATGHRKPYSAFVRMSRDENSKKLWREEARADAATPNNGRGSSGYHQLASGEIDRKTFNLAAGAGAKHYHDSHPGHYRDVQRRIDTARAKPGKGFEVNRQGTAVPAGTKQKRRFFVVGRKGETIQKGKIIPYSSAWELPKKVALSVTQRNGAMKATTDTGKKSMAHMDKIIARNKAGDKQESIRSVPGAVRGSRRAKTPYAGDVYGDIRVGKALTNEQIKHRKRVQAGIATTTATLGLAALGTRSAGAVAGRVGRLVPHAARLNNASTTLTTAGAGVGGVGGYNYAAYTRAEGKKKR